MGKTFKSDADKMKARYTRITQGDNTSNCKDTSRTVNTTRTLNCKDISLNVKTVQDSNCKYSSDNTKKEPLTTQAIISIDTPQDLNCKDTSDYITNRKDVLPSVKAVHIVKYKGSSETGENEIKRRKFKNPREIKSKAVNFRMRPSVHERLLEAANAKGLSIIDALEQAIIAYSESMNCKDISLTVKTFHQV